jgi:hypothetical protein
MEKEKQVAKVIKSYYSVFTNKEDTLAKIPNEVPADGKKFSLKELQGFVGGMIEILPCVNSDFLLICNEESKLQDTWEINQIATNLYKFGVPAIGNENGDVIAGDVLLVHKSFIRS